jgi:hypothetical protein
MRRTASASGVCLLLATGCSNGSGDSLPVAGGCTTDQNGVQGGRDVFFVTVTDSAFSVGGADSGSMQPNITIENGATVTLTLYNAGTVPHGLMVLCQDTPNGNGCPMQSCFPPDADIPAVQPGQSATTTFMAPLKEGAYPFVPALPGDTPANPDGGVPSGEFLLM